MIRFFLGAIAICPIMEQFLALVVSSNNTCGAATKKGSDVIYPWVAALTHTGTDPLMYFCGGTVISKLFVISGEKVKVIHDQALLFCYIFSCSLHFWKKHGQKTFAK